MCKLQVESVSTSKLSKALQIVDWMLQKFSWTEDIRNAGRIYKSVREGCRLKTTNKGMRVMYLNMGQPYSAVGGDA